MRCAVVTVSGRSARRARGPERPAPLKAAGRLVELSDRESLHFILTTGGMGPAPRAVTPGATGDVRERDMPGLADGR